MPGEDPFRSTPTDTPEKPSKHKRAVERAERKLQGNSIAFAALHTANAVMWTLLDISESLRSISKNMAHR